MHGAPFGRLRGFTRWRGGVVCSVIGVLLSVGCIEHAILADRTTGTDGRTNRVKDVDGSRI